MRPHFSHQSKVYFMFGLARLDWQQHRAICDQTLMVLLPYACPRRSSATSVCTDCMHSERRLSHERKSPLRSWAILSESSYSTTSHHCQLHRIDRARMTYTFEATAAQSSEPTFHPFTPTGGSRTTSHVGLDSFHDHFSRLSRISTSAPFHVSRRVSTIAVQTCQYYHSSLCIRMSQSQFQVSLAALSTTIPNVFVAYLLARNIAMSSFVVKVRPFVRCYASS